MPSGEEPSGTNSKIAYGCHVGIAIILCIVLATQIQLMSSQASADVVGGAIFLLICLAAALVISSTKIGSQIRQWRDKAIHDSLKF